MGRQGIDRKSFSAKPDDYKLVEEVGHGVSAVVYRAIYLPTNDVVAVKCLDLERCNSNLDSIQKEAQTMSLMDHPNLITSYCSFVVERYLWVIMPFMAGGSCLHIMKYSHPDGLPESVICSILKETLKALEYLHAHGHIHRDVKAGNILLDSDGMVKLGDFGVSACMFDKGDRQRTRNTFVGTPCWMAPEVMQPGGGYDFKADIWSFAITGLELAHGHAPFSKYPPMKVLLLTLQNAPPGLDYDRDKKFSKSFKEMIAMCLVKDPKKRPTATKLLKHSFFKRGKPPGLSLKKVLLDLPPIWERVKSLQLKDAAQLAQKEMPFSEQEALSQREYKKSVSGWNFDLEDLKIRASLIQDDDEVTGMMDEDQRMKVVIDEMNTSSSGSGLEMTTSFNGIDYRESTSGSEVSQPEYLNEIADFSNKENFDENGNSELALQASENAVQGCPKMTNKSQFQKGPLNPKRDLSYSLSEKALTFQRPENKQHAISEKSKHNMLRVPTFNCTLLHPGLASMNSLSASMRTTGGPWDPLEDSSKPSFVQVKGRFSVTSESLDLVKESCMRKSASVGDFLQDSKLLPPCHSSKEPYNGPACASSLSFCLRSLLVHISILQDCALISLNGLQQDEEEHAFQKGKPSPQHLNIENAATEEVSHFERGNPLLLKIEEFENRMIDLIDELTVQNFKQMQLHERRSAPNCPNEDHAQQRENN